MFTYTYTYSMLNMKSEDSVGVSRISPLTPTQGETRVSMKHRYT